MDTKVVVAAGFAAVGIGVGAWGLLGGRPAVARAAAAEPVVLAPVDADGAVVEPEYASTRGSGSGEVVSALVRLAAERAARVAGFGSQGAGAAGAFAGAVEGVVGPLVRGDHDGFVEAMRAIGGAIPGEFEGEHPVFAALAGLLEGAEVDVSRLVVRAHEARTVGGPAAAGLPVGGDRTVRVSRGEEGEGAVRRERRSVREIRPGRMFEEAGALMDERAVEVSFPFRARGEKQEKWFGMVLVWRGELKVWQPGAFRVETRGVRDDG